MKTRAALRLDAPVNERPGAIVIPACKCQFEVGHWAFSLIPAAAPCGGTGWLATRARAEAR